MPGTPVQGRSTNHQRARMAGLGATVAFTASEKENAKATYTGGVGFVPNLATCENVDDVLATGPRPGNATSNPAARSPCWTWPCPGCPGHSGDGCWSAWTARGSPMTYSSTIAAGGEKQGRRWEFSVGWAGTDREVAAIHRAPKELRQPAIGQDGNVLDERFAADLTGLMDLDGCTRFPACGHRPRRTAASQVPQAGLPTGRNRGADATS